MQSADPVTIGCPSISNISFILIWESVVAAGNAVINAAQCGIFGV